MGAIENMGEFGMGVNCDMANLKWGRFAMWANCITYSAAPARGLCPYNVRKHTHANINVQ